MKKEKFNYVYTAPTEEERKEIESIRVGYVCDEQPMSKLERLRYLDRRVRGVASGVAITVGVIGSLLFGLGLAMVLEWKLLWQGTLVAAAGGLPIGLAYPLREKLLKKGKKKYGGEILRLSEELLKEE